MIVTGRCKKPLGKRTFKKLRKCGAKQGDTLSDFMDSLSLNSNQLNFEHATDCSTENEIKDFNCVNEITDDNNAVYDQRNENAGCKLADDKAVEEENDKREVLSRQNDECSNNSTSLPGDVR